MGIRIQIIAILGSLAILAVVFRLLQQRRLKEEYSILWLVITLSLLFVSVFRQVLDSGAKLIGIYYAPAALFLVMLLGAYLLLMHFSLVFSKLTAQNVKLAQELGLLRAEVESLRKSSGPESGSIPS